jgi:extracellular factor (EF) 3-hydroxypalmitic acid methyl ester biosynthesis protein
MTRPAPVRESRSQRLRARRIRVDVLRFGEVSVTAAHPSTGPFSARVEDLSLHGMALIIVGLGPQAALVEKGDRLEQLTVRCADGVLFQGSATVKRVAARADDLVVGVELESEGIDLGELYRRGTRQSFAERWQVVNRAAQHPDMSPEFKAWVSDLHAYLEATQIFLRGEEQALRSEDRLAQKQALHQYLDEVGPQLVEHLNQASAELGRLVKDLSEEEHAIHRAYFRMNVLHLLLHSPLLRRSYEKPLGYAGDYEMMNMLYRDHAEGESLFGQALNLYAAQEGAARANINRIEYLGGRIREAVAAHPTGPRLRIASIGCGPAREIGALLESSPELGRRIDVKLVDQEERSIGYCERTLAPLARATGAHIEFIRESIRRLLTARQLSLALGERDLIYSAGLFDYLNERTFMALLGALYDALVPGGLLAVGNVAAHNPSRWMMEYYCDWFLRHRSPEVLTAHAAGLKPLPSSVQVDAEPLGVNLFLLVRR